MERREKLKRTFEKFEKALDKFREIVGHPHLFDFLSGELIVEVSTKRFEYTFESMWKTLKEYLREEGVDCPTPLNAFKEAFKAGIIEEKYEDVFLEMIERRNQIVHVYDSEQAQVIYAFLKSDDVLSAIESVYKKIKELEE